jgi:hypothetical protein
MGRIAGSKQMIQNNLNMTAMDRTARALQLGQNSLARTSETGQSRQVRQKSQSDHVSLDKTNRRGWPEHVSKDRAGTGQLG